MKKIENLLSKILILPGFIDPRECESLRRVLDDQAEGVDLALLGSQPPTLDSRLWEGDMIDPGALAREARSGVAGQLLLERYLDPADRDPPLGAREGAVSDDVVKAVGARALTRAAADLDLFPAIASSIVLPEGSPARAELSDLLAEGVLRVRGDAYTRRDPLNADEELCLRWFNVRVLEDVVFPNGLRKGNRLLRGSATPAALVAAMAEPGPDRAQPPILELLCERHPELAAALGADSRSALLGALRRMLWALPVQLTLLGAYRGTALARLGDRGDASSPRFDALRADPTRRDVRAAGSYPRCRAVHAVLHLFFPELVLPPPGPRVVRAVRDTQTLQVPELQPRLDAHVRRLAVEYAEPYYGIHLQAGPDRPHILVYREGGHYVPHVDSESLQVDSEGRAQWTKIIARDLSVLVYLSRSSDFSGGALVFPDLRVSIAPEEGMAVAFPSDHRFRHAAATVTRGTRYAIVAWLTCAEGAPVGSTGPVTW